MARADPLPKPLVIFFLLLRLGQIILFAIIVGITAHVVTTNDADGSVTAPEIMATLGVTSVAGLYCIISVLFTLTNTHVALRIIALFDFLLLAVFILIAYFLGRPAAYLNCKAIGSTAAGTNASSGTAVAQSMVGGDSKLGELFDWASASGSNCDKLQVGARSSFAFCVFFFFSAFIALSLSRHRQRALTKGPAPGSGGPPGGARAPAGGPRPGGA